MGQEIKLEGEELSKAIDKFLDDVFVDEEDVEKSKKMKASEKEEELEDEEEKKEKKEEVKKDDSEDEDEEKSLSSNSEDESASLYKTGYMHGVEHAHGARDEMHKSKKDNTDYQNGFKAGHEAAKAHLEKEHMKKSNESNENTEVLTKAMTDLVQTVTSLKEQNESLAKAVEKLSKTPAPRKSLQAVDFVKKSNGDGEDVDVDAAPAVADKANLAKSFARAGDILHEEGIKKGLLNARDIAEFETTQKHSNPEKYSLIKRLVNKHFNEGVY